MPLFEVAVLEKTEQVVTRNGKPVTVEEERLVLPPKTVVAKDEKGAVASALIGETIEAEKSNLVVLVRPFSTRA